MAFTLHIFESEYKEIQDFVLKYPNIETGGDLFGLWKTTGEPVVQLIIGPGQNCRRTSVSFHQDTNYLSKFGTFVNSSYMLCHIGSWHSHHQLSLSQPSAGDRSTVCNNFPEGLQRYIMIIANIGRGGSGRHSVVIHPYMFTNGGHVCRQGSVHKIPESSPFREVGRVLSHLGQGAEQASMDKEDYLSRVPSEYHQRPTTQSKSYSPMKVESSRYVLPSAHSKPSHQWTDSSHNHLSNDANRHSPMEVDPRDNLRAAHNQPKSQYQALERSSTRTNKATQWYETEEGGSKLKDIRQEIIGTNMAREPNFHRDLQSKNLTMQFTHYGQEWVIKFPKSFDDKPAVIECYGKNVQSKNVVKDIRKACKCLQCRDHELQDQHPPSKQDHRPFSPLRRDRSPSRLRQDRRQPSALGHHRPSSPPRGHPPSPPNRPQSRRTSQSPITKPWYNTQSGKTILEQIKTDIETYVKATSNVGRVRVWEDPTSKEVIFYHDRRDWIIELVNNSRQEVNLKNQEHGKKKFVAKLSSPYDVVSALNQHCSCSRCRTAKRSPSGQRNRSALTPPNSRPNSRYAISKYVTNGVSPSTPSQISPTRDHEKFFASMQGEGRFRKICSDISVLLLSGKRLDITRKTESKNIEVNFEHNRMQWKVTFPFNFPECLPKVEFANVYSHRTVGRFYSLQVRSDNVVRAIREECLRRSCRRYNRR